MSLIFRVGSKLRSGAAWPHVRRYSTVRGRTHNYQDGQKIAGYTIRKVAPIDELSLTAVLLDHDRTGAQHLHVSRDDGDNVFGVSFRTTPMDSTGVPHILEHTALCGSQAFPVRDPFFKMLNRSLSTFMNAFTAYDWTMYPFSTQNAQDYENLMKVYLDSAFFPRLLEQDFRQEGWRLEHENLDDLKSPITFKGVVYNEMKGVYTSSQNIFHTKHLNFLLPSHTYGVCSGGQPENITELSWQQLRDFHSSHYHPSNARFYTYGTFPLERHLELIEENVLSKFEKIDPKTEVPSEPRWTAPREHVITCGPDPMAADPNKQTTVAVSYLLTDITNVQENFNLKILGELLTSGEKAPFYKSLITANIGSDFSPVLGYSGDTKDAYFSVGLQGIHDDDIEKVKDIVGKTIDQVIEEGFEQERIDALLHRIELGLKHQSDKFGLNLGVAIISPWNHGADPTELLQTQKCVEQLQKQLAENPHFLQDKVKQYLKDNPHCLTVIMRPSDDHEAKIQEEERSRLHHMVSQLTENERDQIYQDGLSLASKQMAEEDLSCLPSVKVADIQPRLPVVETDTIYAEGVPIQVTEQPTCGINYFRAISNIRDLSAELKPYVPLFCGVVTKMGAGLMDFQELSQQMELHTGGMTSSPVLCEHHSLGDTYEETGRGVPVIVPKSTVPALDFLADVEVRRKAHVKNSNPYLFADRGSGAIRIYDAIARMCKEADLEAPKKISSTTLRKLMATLIQGILFNSFCLEKNTDKMFELWTDVFHRLDLSNKDRLSTLIQMSAAELSNSIVGSGHQYAMTHAASHVSPVAWLRENMSGMTQVSLMKRLAESQDLSSVVGYLKDIADHVLNRKNLRCSLNSTTDAAPSLQVATERFVGNLRHAGKPTGQDTHTQDPHFCAVPAQTHFTLPFQVNYASRSVKTVPYSHENFASLRILARLMTNKYLHREVREKGGAYGGGASGNSPGLFNFYSYRDPNSMSTLSAFDGAVDWATSGQFSPQDIDEAKLAIFAQTDAPVTPGSRGQRLFLLGIDDEMRQSHREQLFAVGKDDLVSVADRYLSSGQRVSAVTLLGPENPLTKDDESWTVKQS